MEVQYNDEKELIGSNIDLLRKFQSRNIFLNIKFYILPLVFHDLRIFDSQDVTIQMDY